MNPGQFLCAVVLLILCVLSFVRGMERESYGHTRRVYGVWYVLAILLGLPPVVRLILWMFI